MPEVPYIFLLRGTGICLVLFYIYPIVPHSPAFLHSFLLLVTVVKSICLKRHLYFYSVVLEFSCVILYLSDSTPRTSIFRKFLLLVNVVKSIGSKINLYFCSLALKLLLSSSILCRNNLCGCVLYNIFNKYKQI